LLGHLNVIPAIDSAILLYFSSSKNWFLLEFAV